MEWRSFRDDGHASVEEVAAWLESLKPFVRESLLGQIDALVELAATGEIVFDPNAQDDPKAPLKPIWDQPELYELRWTLLSKKLRQYHGEPASHPDLLVDLHLHFKGNGNTQDQEISQAVLRYRAGERGVWR